MVFSCSYCKVKCENGIGCFSFPKNKKICDRWLAACGYDVHPKNNTLKLKLCSLHFEEDCLSTKSNGRKLLKPNAVPTILNNNKRKVMNISPSSIHSEVPNTTYLEQTQDHNIPGLHSMKIEYDEDVDIKMEYNEVSNSDQTNLKYSNDFNPNDIKIEQEILNPDEVKLEYDNDDFSSDYDNGELLDPLGTIEDRFVDEVKKEKTDKPLENLQSVLTSSNTNNSKGNDRSRKKVLMCMNRVISNPQCRLKIVNMSILLDCTKKI